MLLQLGRKKLGAVKYTGSNPLAKTARDLDWLITLPSCVAFSKFLAVKEAKTMKPHYSVIFIMSSVHIQFSGCGIPTPNPKLKEKDGQNRAHY